jgi:hypothetical protein
LVVPKEGGSQGERTQSAEKPGAAPLCGGWHRGAGESSRVDLGAVRDAYKDLAAQLEKPLERTRADFIPDLDRPYDAGLPACRGDVSRSEPIAPEKAGRLRGRVLYFAAATRGGLLDLPDEILSNPRAEILILRVAALKDFREISRRAGRPVSLAGAEFAQSLGVRCTGTVVTLSEKGDALLLREAR